MVPRLLALSGEVEGRGETGGLGVGQGEEGRREGRGCHRGRREDWEEGRRGREETRRGEYVQYAR